MARIASLNSTTFAALSVCLTALAGCGGGGGSDPSVSSNSTSTPSSVVTPAPAPTTSTSSTKTTTAAPVAASPAAAATPAPAPAAATTTTTSTTTTTTSTSTSAAVTTAVANAVDWTSVETPQNWDYTLSYPSRSACASNEGLTYEVGPNSKYTNPRDVPWLKLAPCDQVLINYRAQPYTDIVFIGSRGAQNKYITIKGVPGPNGERPIFDGTNAVAPTNSGMNPVYDGLGMIIVGSPTYAAAPTRTTNHKPGYLHITGLNVRNVRQPTTYTNLSQVSTPWPAFTAGIYASPAEHLAITNCELADNGLGVFVNSVNGESGQSRWLLIARNYFHGNGVAGEASMHNSYTEAIGTIYEYNYFGQPVTGTLGDNIKERSAGVIFRYNYIDGGTYAVSLRDPQSNGAFEALAKDVQGDLLTKNAFVYSNIFRLRTTTQAMIGHGDGVAFGDGQQYRFGNLFFYGNKVISESDYVMYNRDTVSLFQMLNVRSPATVAAINNLFYAKSVTANAQPAPFSIFTWQGLLSYQSNWINTYVLTDPNWGNRTTGVYVGTKFDGTGLGSVTKQTGSPGFTNLLTGDLTPLVGSAFTTLLGTLPADVLKRSLSPTDVPVQLPALVSQ